MKESDKMGRTLPGIVVGVATIWSTLPTAAATCYATGFSAATGGYCDGCQYHGVLTTGRNEPCDKQFQQPGSGAAADIVYLGARISQKAKHGLAGAGGNAVAYRPDKDYVGSDEFTVEGELQAEWRLRQSHCAL